MSYFYKEIILDYYKSTDYKKKISHPSVEHQEQNTSCGDIIHIQIAIEDNTITQIGFSGSGCVISQATAAMLYEALDKKTLDAAAQFSDQDLASLVSIELGPVRFKCAQLSLEAIQNAIKKYITNKNKNTC